MKSILCACAFSVFLALSAAAGIPAEPEGGSGPDIIRKAMKDEMARSMQHLALEELKRPFFIAYTICDADALSVEATLGALVRSEETPLRKQRVRVMVGDYGRTNENYMEMGGGPSFSFGQSIPLEDDYAGIRRSLWLETDEQYKEAAEKLEAKLSAIKQQNLSEEQLSLPDFTRHEPVHLVIESPDFPVEKEKWEAAAKELSEVFGAYPQIQSSGVSVFLYRARAFYLDSEGSETQYPVTLAAVRVSAQTQATDGEPLLDHLLRYAPSPDGLPDVAAMKAETKALADRLAALREAPAFEDSYSGPVLFEDQAVAEIAAQRLFAGTSGLVALRKPIFGQAQMGLILGGLMGESLESKLGRKLTADCLSITAAPKTKAFNGTPLIGAFEVDTEAVVPPDELVLVKDGVLQTLLNGRTPTEKIPESNGHNRTTLQFGFLGGAVGPGVIRIDASGEETRETLKRKLIERARDDDLDYAVLIRKMESPNAGIEKELDPTALLSFASGGGGQDAVSPPILVYRVSLEDGAEELVRGAELSGISVSAFKKVAGASATAFAYNTMLEKSMGGMGLSGLVRLFMSGGPSGMSGMPASFIVPDALLFEELDVREQKRAITTKPPVAKNPVGL